MSTFSEETISRLKASLPIISEFKRRFEFNHATIIDYGNFKNLYNHVKKITNDENLEDLIGVLPQAVPTSRMDLDDIAEINDMYAIIADNLRLYVTALVENFAVKEKIDLLIKENIELRKQVDETAKREMAYIAVFSDGDKSSILDKETRVILLGSLKRQYKSVLQNQMRLKEIEAKLGMYTPPHVLNEIENTQNVLEGIMEKAKQIQGSGLPTENHSETD